jgi:hypothetical protein
LRHGAPERPDLAEAAAGVFAGAIGAAFYATHCPDDSPLFVATWYSLAIGLVVVAGKLAGRQLLRWYSGYVFQPARMSTTLGGQIGKIYVTLIVRICHRLDGLYESMEWRNGHMILSSEGIIEQDDERHNEANQSSEQRHHSQMHP